MKYNALTPTKTGFGEGLLKAGKRNNKVMALGADITGSVGANLFAEAFPERFYSLGIAEQNCVGVATGMALSGKIPVFSTYGVFAAMRTLDQIRISVCYNNVHVVIGGAHAGISVGPDGATHQALEDIAALRALPNITLLSPCDATQTCLATMAAIEDCKGPVYIRFGRNAVPDFTAADQDFSIGKAQQFREGKHLSIFTTGTMLYHALEASEKLAEKGIETDIYNFHTIKPLDIKAIVQSAQKTGAILCVEEHQVHGGFGSAIAEQVVKHHPVPMDFIGMPDCFGESGQPEELLKKYGLSTHNIVKKALKLHKSKAKINFR